MTLHCAASGQTFSDNSGHKAPWLPLMFVFHAGSVDQQGNINKVTGVGAAQVAQQQQQQQSHQQQTVQAQQQQTVQQVSQW